ncbi:hypothetical protein [Candidatus Methanodesulfokora washburnensis]|uniref:hypothetical protein n=1 Tax=Candidatus Methanodesulfokora washburnensis TaxID=2478471 RepID=UPI000F79B7AD|nr:hypothetical protein [Candidatus Methanodesulfokores washburnensis]
MIAVGRDGEAFLLPDEFNKVIEREKVKVNSEKEALEVIMAYLNCSIVYGEIKILYNASDIPKPCLDEEWCSKHKEECEKEIKRYEELRGIITPPKIYLENETYTLDFFTWANIGGVVEKWRIKVERDGTVNILDRKVIANHIGCYFELA